MKSPTNVLFILTDDQGYGDLSCMGSDFVRTPHIDALAAKGARCMQWYAGSSVCSPSRAALLTGRFPANAGVRAILGGHRTASGLSPHVPTIARILGEHGYATFLSGKWHLGGNRAYWPDQHGFQRWFGFVSGCVDYFSHIFYHGMGPGHNALHDLWEDGQERWLEGATSPSSSPSARSATCATRTSGGSPSSATWPTMPRTTRCTLRSSTRHASRT